MEMSSLDGSSMISDIKTPNWSTSQNIMFIDIWKRMGFLFLTLIANMASISSMKRVRFWPKVIYNHIMPLPLHRPLVVAIAVDHRIWCHPSINVRIPSSPSCITLKMTTLLFVNLYYLMELWNLDSKQKTSRLFIKWYFIIIYLV